MMKSAIKSAMNDLTSSVRGHFVEVLSRMELRSAPESLISHLESWAATSRACLEALKSEVDGMPGPSETSSEGQGVNLGVKLAVR